MVVVASYKIKYLSTKNNYVHEEQCISLCSWKKMRTTGSHTRLTSVVNDISNHTPFTKMVLLLTLLWLIFSAGIYQSEQGVDGPSIKMYGEQSVADSQVFDAGQSIGGLWVAIGSVLVFGTIVATNTGYFMGSMQRPDKKSLIPLSTTWNS